MAPPRLLLARLRASQPSRYVDISSCAFVVDLDLPEQREPHYLREARRRARPRWRCAHSRSTGRAGLRAQAEWEVLTARPFLDAERSPGWARAFYVPLVSRARNQYGTYYIARRREGKKA